MLLLRRFSLHLVQPKVPHRVEQECPPALEAHFAPLHSIVERDGTPLSVGEAGVRFQHQGDERAPVGAMYAGTKLSTVALTNERFTSGAVLQAEANRVRLVQRSELEEMLGKHTISNIEFDSEMFQWAPQTSSAA